MSSPTGLLLESWSWVSLLMLIVSLPSKGTVLLLGTTSAAMGDVPISTMKDEFGVGKESPCEGLIAKNERVKASCGGTGEDSTDAAREPMRRSSPKDTPFRRVFCLRF